MQLVLDERARWKRLGQDFSRVLRGLVERIGLKEAAAACGVDAGTMAHALAGRKRHVRHAEWVVVLLSIAPEDAAVEVLEFIAGLRGRETVPMKPMAPEDEVMAWRAAVAELPGDFRKVLETRVKSWRQSGGGTR